MYGFSVSVSGDMDAVVQRVTEALGTEGFGILTEIDVQKTLKAKLDVDGRAYKILGACNPALAHKVLGIDADVGMLLPCNVVVREEEDGSMTVSFLDPVTLLALAENPAINEMALEVKKRLERVRDSLG